MRAKLGKAIEAVLWGRQGLRRGEKVGITVILVEICSWRSRD